MHIRRPREAAAPDVVGLDHQQAVADGEGLGRIALALAGGLVGAPPRVARAPPVQVEPGAVELVGEHRTGRAVTHRLVRRAGPDRQQRRQGHGQGQAG
jgi:hypothetical protein